MAMMHKSTRDLDLDEDGYLRKIDEWSIHFVEDYAAKEGIKEIKADHWKLIAAIRFAYEKNGTAPLCRDILKDAGFTKAAVYELFPAGGPKSAYKLAGLPKPPEVGGD